MENILTTIQGLEFNRSVDELGSVGHVLTTWELTILVATLVVGLLYCFLGLKLVRLWSAIIGLLIGFGLGGGLSLYFGLEKSMEYLPLIIGAVTGVILAGLGAWLYRAGAFLLAFFIGAGVSLSLIQPSGIVLVIVCVVIGLVVAVLTAKFAEPMIIVVTSIYGAFMTGAVLSVLLGLHSGLVRNLISVGLVLIGIVLQFLMESGKRKKRHLKKANEIRRAESTENEVNRARAMMGELDQAPVPGKEAVREDDDLEFVDLDK